MGVVFGKSGLKPPKERVRKVAAKTARSLINWVQNDTWWADCLGNPCKGRHKKHQGPTKGAMLVTCSIVKFLIGDQRAQQAGP